jgi:hypothetical protein
MHREWRSPVSALLEEATSMVWQSQLKGDSVSWLREYEYKMWVDFRRKKQPNKWVTLRAPRVLKAALD